MLSFQLRIGLSLLLSSNFKMYILNEVKKAQQKEKHKINALLSRLTITRNLWLNEDTQKRVKLQAHYGKL